MTTRPDLARLKRATVVVVATDLTSSAKSGSDALVIGSAALILRLLRLESVSREADSKRLRKTVVVCAAACCWLTGFPSRCWVWPCASKGCGDYRSTSVDLMVVLLLLLLVIGSVVGSVIQDLVAVGLVLLKLFNCSMPGSFHRGNDFFET